MNAKEKRSFIRSLIRSVESDVLSRVPHMPADWDGHELREYIAGKFKQESSRVMTDQRARRVAFNRAVASIGGL